MREPVFDAASAVRISSRSVSVGAFAAWLIAVEGPARAEPEVRSDTYAQLYELRSPTGQTVLTRRRVTTMLGVSGYDLLDRASNPKNPSLTLRARLRYDADYGANAGEADAQNTERYVPGFERGPMDLMYAYLEGRRFLGGMLGFRLGRQYQTDVLGYWSFDGAEVRVSTPFYCAVEAYGGLEVRGGLPLSSPRFERDGVWRADRERLDPRQYGSLMDSAMAPAWGAAIETMGIPFLSARLTYRKVWSTGSAPTQPFGDVAGPASALLGTGPRLSQERLGMSANLSLGRHSGGQTGFVYDLYSGRPQSWFASYQAYPTERVTLSADYDFVRPIYDADSIWNFFVTMPTHHIGARANLEATRKLSLLIGAGARAFGNANGPSAPGASDARSYVPIEDAAWQASAEVGARYTAGRGRVAWRGDASNGYGGHRLGADLSGEYLIERRFLLLARASLWRFSDSLRADRSADSFGYVAGLNYLMGPRNSAGVEFEHNTNRLVGDRYRVLFYLNAAVTP
jgi:hypothetical protein